MTNRSFLKKSVITVGFLSFFSFSSQTFGATDEEKLKELERAMTAPSPASAPASIVKKPRTRAIVFDTESSAATKAPSAPIEPKVATPADCAALPVDAQTTAVDFPIQFKAGSSEVAPSSESILRQIAKILSLAPDKCVLVEGHTDISGNADMNMELSRERAGSVVKFIVQKVEMEPKRFVPIGKGSSDLLKNLDPRNPLHRRVVFKVVG